jgi:hypothetical protein
MSIFKLFGTKPKEVNLSPIIETPVELPEANNEQQDDSKKEESSENKQKVITIKWGTGMPIDVIFNFIHKDFEDEGYQDALVNSDLQYRETKEGIIRNDLKMLFKRISLRYKSDVREIEVQMRNAQEAYAMSSASLLQARKETYEEHLAEIAEMERLLEANDPKMMTMIESYRRGFLKGISAITLKFINNE